VGIYSQLAERFRQDKEEGQNSESVNTNAAPVHDASIEEDTSDKSNQRPEEIKTSPRPVVTGTFQNALGCVGCSWLWKGWCAYESPTFRNREWIPSCPKPEDAPMLNPGLEKRYGQEPLKLCRDCIVRHSCARFIGLAWFFPDCREFIKEN